MAQRIVTISCRKCGQELADAIEGALVFCKKCRTWNGTVPETYGPGPERKEVAKKHYRKRKAKKEQ